MLIATNQGEKMRYIKTIMLAIIVVLGTNNIVLTYKNNQLKSNIAMIVKDVADRQHTIDELNSTNSKLKDDLFWCKHANGQLLEYCDPSGIKKAINKTPLPKRG